MKYGALTVLGVLLTALIVYALGGSFEDKILIVGVFFVVEGVLHIGNLVYAKLKKKNDGADGGGPSDKTNGRTEAEENISSSAVEQKQE